MTDYRGINSLFNQQTTYPACRLSNKIWRPWPGAPNDSANLPSSPRCVRPFSEAPAILSYLPCTIFHHPGYHCTVCALSRRPFLTGAVWPHDLPESFDFFLFSLSLTVRKFSKSWKSKEESDEAENESSWIDTFHDYALKRDASVLWSIANDPQIFTRARATTRFVSRLNIARIALPRDTPRIFAYCYRRYSRQLKFLANAQIIAP